MPNPFRHVLTKSLTETQKDLLENYIPQAQEEEDIERKRFQPLRMLLDFINRGQYVTANIAEAAVRRSRGERGEGTNILTQARQGWRGKQKGDWEKVLFGGQAEGGEEFEGWLPQATQEKLEKPLIPWTDRKGKERGAIRPSKWIGFLANVLLDPTSYIGFGPSKAAKLMKGSYADDAIKVLKRMVREPEDLLKIAKKSGFDEKAARELLERAGGMVGKQTSQAYKQAQRRFLRTPAKTLRKEMGEDVTNVIRGEEGRLFQKLADLPEGLTGKLRTRQDKYAADLVEKWTRDIKPFEDIQKNLPTLYEHAGERSWRLPWGSEYNVGVREPGMLGRGMNWMRNQFTTSEWGSTLSDAWFSVTSRGVGGKGRELIDEIRKELNFLNPYEKSLRLKELDAGAVENVTKNTLLKEVWRLTPDKKLYDPAGETIRRATEIGGGIRTDDVLRNVDEMAAMGIQNPDEISKITRGIEQLTNEMHHNELRAVAEGIIPDLKFVDNYLPGPSKSMMRPGGGKARAMGGAQPGFTKPRTYLPTERIAIEEAWAQKLWKLSPEDAKRFVTDHNLGEFATDLREVLTYRALGHARMMKYVSMVKQFRQFGIPVQNLDELSKKYAGINRALPQLGLTKVSGEAFDGLLFDKPVADIIERVVKATTNMPQTKKLLGGFMSWWRGIVTLSPGFHIRNHISNTLTGYTIHGTKWFDTDRTADALAGVIYVLNKGNPKKALDEAGLTEQWYYKRLNKVRGGKTVKEWADEGWSRSVISTATMGHDPTDYIAGMGQQKNLLSQVGKLMPVGKENVYFQATHAVGNVVENTPRFKSFLISIEEMAQEGGEAMARVADQAAYNARRWWLDYCFDEETEILTSAGWQTWQTMKVGDEALTFSLEREQLEWSAVKDVYTNDYDGEMIAFTSKSFDALVTPNHKWIRIGWERGGHHSITKPKLGLIESKELLGCRQKLLTSCSSYAGPIETFSDKFVELIGWVLTEGTYPKDRIVKGVRTPWRRKRISFVNIAQSVSHNPDYVDEIRALQAYFQPEASFSEGRRARGRGIITWRIGNPLGKLIREMFPDKKLLYEFIRMLTEKQCRILMTTLLKGDGTKKTYKNGGEHWVFSQKDKSFTDAFQALCFLAGRRTTARDKGGVFNTGVYRADRALYTDQCKKDVVQYKGKIWCISTENHTLVARRNGRTYLSGNSDLTDTERAIRDTLIPFYCFDEATEVLTINGWCKRNAVAKGDGIFTVNLETHCIELQEVLGVAEFDYDADLIRIENRNYDALITPNHRCIYDKYIPDDSEFSGEWRIKEAKDLIGSDWLPIATEGWKPKHRAVYTDDFVEMVGWIVCEGSISDVQVNITQSPKNALQRIKWTLLRLGWDYGEYIKSGGCSSIVLRKPPADLFRELIGNPKKLPLSFIFQLTRPQLELLYEVMIEGDGCWDDKSAAAIFLQKDDDIAGAFQILATLIGKASRLTVRDHSKTINRYSQEPINHIRAKTVRHIEVRNGNKRLEPYTGKVWCPSTPNGTVICRRNGKVYPSGQTWIRKNLANQMAGIVAYPEMYAMYPKLQELASIEDPEFDANLIPDWMKDLGAFPVRREDTGEFTFFNPNIPIQDINRLPIVFEEGDWKFLKRRPKIVLRELIDDVVEMSSPVVKQVMSAVTEKGYDAFYKRDLDYYGKAPFVFRLFTKNPKMVGFLDNVVKRMGGNGLGLRVSEQSGKMEMDARIAKLLETNLPVLRTLDRLMLTGTALIPGFEEALTEATGAVDDYDKLDSFFQWLSWYGGIKFKPIDMEEAQREYGSDILERAEKERSRVRSGLPLPRGATSSSTRWQNQNQAYKERMGLP